MKLKRKLLAVITAAATVFSLCACSSENGYSNSDSGKLKIISTVFPPYDLARQIAGDNAEISILLPPGSEIHNYEPSAKDMIAIRNCDIFLYIGGENEQWAEKLINSNDTENVTAVKLIDYVPTLSEDEDEHDHDHDHDHDHEHEHHHDHDEHEHHHDHDEHEHHHGHDEHEHHHEHGEGCTCGCHDHDHEHGHHHADDVFTSWGKETPHKFERAKLEEILKQFVEDDKILRSKGMVEGADGKWIYFDMVPGEYEIRDGEPDYTGRIVVIGTDIHEHELEELFGLA